jgi:hypothetical protein
VKKRKPRKPGRRKAAKRSGQIHTKKNDFLTQLVDAPVTQAVGEALGYAVDTTVEVVVNLLPDGV